MKAWLLEGLGGLEKLKLGEAAEPVAQEGEVVIRIHFAALNPADRYLAEGQYPARPTFPHILGRDGVGEVVAVGANVSGWKTGDVALLLRSDVGVNRNGTLAEKVAVPAGSVTRVPSAWTERESAGAPLVYLTGHQALTQFGALPAGTVMLVTGASGGVGIASIQLAKATGLRAVALSRGTGKQDALLKLGAEFVFDSTDAVWRKKLKESLGGKRVDLVVENIGGELFSDVIDTLGNDGKVSVVGRLAGPVPQFNTASLLFRRVTIRGVMVGAYTPEQSQQTWSEIVRLLDRIDAWPVVDSVFPFEKLLDAFERLRQGPLGKVLVEGPK